mmetsp:Transcript_16297/g.48311  ORF Transcript_16297/g.48311 Transcript_16297/m.48311 type:complete len:492 (+) Transcript_16297:981-2456(+)
MLDSKREPRHRPEGGVHRVAPESRDDHHVGVGVGAELPQRREHRGGHLVLALLAHVVEARVGGGEGAAPIEQDDALCGGAIREEHLLRVERLEVCPHAHHPEGGEPKADRHPVVLLLALHRLEVGQEAARPILRRVCADVRQVLACARLLLRRRHLERRLERAHHSLRREGVHDERAVEHARKARELGQHRHARRKLACGPRDDVLERVGVDRLAHRRVDDDVGHLPQLHPGGEREPLHLGVVEGARVGGADPADDSLNVGPHVARVRDELDLVARGDHHLHQRVARAVPRVRRQHRLPREQLELHALEAVEIVDAGEQPPRRGGRRVELRSQVLELVAGGGGGGGRQPVRQVVLEQRGGDAKSGDLHDDVSASEVDAQEAARLELVLEAEQPLARGEEVARVLEEQEADHVRVQHRSEQLLADGDGAEDVARREGRVQEESDVGGAVAAEQEGGEEEQVVVVRPDEVGGLVHLDDLVCELAVDGAVGPPG